MSFLLLPFPVLGFTLLPFQGRSPLQLLHLQAFSTDRGLDTSLFLTTFISPVLLFRTQMLREPGRTREASHPLRVESLGKPNTRSRQAAGTAVPSLKACKWLTCNQFLLICAYTKLSRLVQEA